MSLLPLTLVVLAAFIHATWNLLSKRAAAAGPTFVFAYNLFACIVYLPWMIWLLVYGDLTWSFPAFGCLVLSAVIHLAYSLCLQRGYQVADLSVVYPIARGTGPMLSSIGAFILLREMPTVQGILGLLAVVAGIGFITTQGDLSAFRRPRGLDGVRWGTATGSLIASYTVVDGYGVKILGIHPVVLDWVTNLLRFFILTPIALSNWARTKEKMKGHWLLAFWVGALSPLSYIPRAQRHRDGRAAQPGRARARNVDDGGRAVRHAVPG
jgi:drug/metabolite transporter (DMT)-like permease